MDIYWNYSLVLLRIVDILCNVLRCIINKDHSQYNIYFQVVRHSYCTIKIDQLITFKNYI